MHWVECSQKKPNFVVFFGHLDTLQHIRGVQMGSITYQRIFDANTMINTRHKFLLEEIGSCLVVIVVDQDHGNYHIEDLDLKFSISWE